MQTFSQFVHLNLFKTPAIYQYLNYSCEYDSRKQKTCTNANSNIKSMCPIHVFYITMFFISTFVMLKIIIYLVRCSG